MLLAIDTATRVAGLALYDQDTLCVEQMWHTSGNHTVELMPYIVRVCEQQRLAPSALRAAAISLGPGSFTGLRVGLSLAKGLALALSIPLLGVPTLDITAFAHIHQMLPICAVLQAGRGRLYVGFYQAVASDLRRQGDYVLVSHEQLVASLKVPTVICGEIDPPLAKALRSSLPELAIVASPAFAARRAGYLAELAWKRLVAGERDDPATLAPIYLQHA